MTDEKQAIKKMDAKEFRELGLLQEVNRRFLHPMGLALEIVVDDDTGEHRFGEVWDYRDDPEGIVFAEGIVLKDKAAKVAELFHAKFEERSRKFGWHIQPAEPKPTVKSS